MSALKGNFSIAIYVLFSIIFIDFQTTAAKYDTNLFALDIFQKILPERSQENVIISPTSILSCVVLSYFGAHGETANEMHKALRLGNGKREKIAKEFGEFIENSFEKYKNETDLELHMVNHIYVNQGLKIRTKFNKLATKYFRAKAENINFGDAVAAVKNINSFIAQQTNHKIKELLKPTDVNDKTSLIFVNAIYFKADWETEFLEEKTHKADFFVDGKVKKSVDMMTIAQKFSFADVKALDATAIKIPYKYKDLSMLILLPNKLDGLAEMEVKLIGKDLNKIVSKMNVTKVELYMPKFRIEFGMDLKETFEELGIKLAFNDKNADFSNLIRGRASFIREIKHKAFIEVNEKGSEAVAATGIEISNLKFPSVDRIFRIDHPFMFTIIGPNAMYFAGHVTKL